MAEIPPTRESLLVRLRDPRDGAAWAEFVELYGPVVYGYARKQRLQDADAADLCQDVLQAVAGAVGRLEYDPAKGAFRNWLFTVVRRKLWNWRAAQENRAQGSGDSAIHQLLEQVRPPRRKRPRGRPSGKTGCSPGPARGSAVRSRAPPGSPSGGCPSTVSRPIGWPPSSA
jgi:RNA polymerase sigma-70 factor (ECF subfamily)